MDISTMFLAVIYPNDNNKLSLTDTKKSPLIFVCENDCERRSAHHHNN